MFPGVLDVLPVLNMFAEVLKELPNAPEVDAGLPPKLNVVDVLEDEPLFPKLVLTGD